jgi:hypothetical protein
MFTRGLDLRSRLEAATIGLLSVVIGGGGPPDGLDQRVRRGAVRRDHAGDAKMAAWTFLIMFGCRMADVWTCGSVDPPAGFRWCFTMGRPVLPLRCGRWNERRMRAGFAW